MKRLIIFKHTGAAATNLAIARRLSRKLLGAQRSGHCVLVDFERVEASRAFLQILLNELHPEKIKFCGLPINLQSTQSLNRPSREGRR